MYNSVYCQTLLQAGRRTARTLRAPSGPCRGCADQRVPCCYFIERLEEIGMSDFGLGHDQLIEL